MVLTINSSGKFRYEFDSSGDFRRLNEWVLKPFLTFTLLIIGINVSINKGYFSKGLQILMIVFSSFFFISTIISGSRGNSILIPIAGLILIILFSIIKYKSSSQTDVELILDNIEQNKNSKKKTLRLISIKKWKGSSLFVFLILSLVLFFNSPIAIENTNIKTNLTSLETILTSTIKLLSFGCIVVSILININFTKLKLSVIILGILSLIHIVLTLVHNNFQTSIFPCIIILLSSILYLKKKKKC